MEVPGFRGELIARDDTYLRLAEVKANYDPDNVFHNNKNIKPNEPGTWSSAR